MKLKMIWKMESFLMLLYLVFRSLRIFKTKCVLLCEVVWLMFKDSVGVQVIQYLNRDANKGSVSTGGTRWAGDMVVRWAHAQQKHELRFSPNYTSNSQHSNCSQKNNLTLGNFFFPL